MSSVDLVAQPTLNAEIFRPLVAQKAGAAYSAADITKTAAALQRAGHFTRVDVEIRPEAAGLRVSFILHPVYYVGSIAFPGATKEFRYTRLLQEVNYPDQAPYEASLADRARPALIHFFAQQGYFNANVQVEPKTDPARKLVDIIYQVTLGKRAKFGDVEITGVTPAESAQLKSSLTSFHALLHGATVKEGKPFSPGHLTAATSLLRDKLGQQNFLANHVRLAHPAYDAATNRAALHWDVTLGVTVRVSVTGAKVSKKTLKAQIPIYEENAFDQDLVTEGQRNLVSYFQAKGFFDVKVAPQTTHAPSEISLVYHIDLGARHRVTAVNITGDQHAKAADLFDQVVVQKARFFFFSHGKFSNDLLNTSVNNLKAYYHNLGYEDVEVRPRVTTTGNTLHVDFQITESQLTTVASFHLQGNKTEPLSKLAPKGLHLQVGRAYSQALLDKDRSYILASYLDMGYPNVTLKWSTRPANGNRHKVAVTFMIDEGPSVHIANVDFEGQSRTRLSFLQHNTSVKPEAPLSEDTMLASESSLYNLGIFDWASVVPREPVDEQPTDDVLVRVHEENRNSITYGFGGQYTPVGGSLSSGIVALPGLPTLGLPKNFKVLEKNIFSPLGSIDYTRLNLRGTAETASIGTFLSLLDQRATFNYTDPQFRGLKWSSLLTFSAERTAQNPLFTARLGTASLQFEKTLNKAKTKRLQFRYQFQRTSLTDLLIQNFIPSGDESVHSSMVAGSFINDTRDNALNAHHGVFETLDLGISPKVFGSTDNFARFFGQAAYYKRVVPWMVFANDVRVGLVSSFAGSHVPISERFFSGGANSLRGFPLNEAGPQVLATLCSKANDPSSCTATISAPTGGNQLFIFNSEGRFPLHMIYKNLGGVLFYDGGNVYSHIGFKDFFHDYSNTIGFGLRYNTPVGPIRIDVGRNLNPVSGLKATNLFITLGQAF